MLHLKIHNELVNLRLSDSLYINYKTTNTTINFIIKTSIMTLDLEHELEENV